MTITNAPPQAMRQRIAMNMRKLFWIAFGAVNQLLFGLTILRLFLFLKGGNEFHPWISSGTDSGHTWLVVDSLLAIQFAVLHSAMLWPPNRARLNRFMPSALSGSFFCFMTCISLFVTMELWMSSPTSLWNFSGNTGRGIFVMFLISWLALTYSLWLTGFGFQTGFSLWWAWVRGQEPPRRSFQPKGAYKLLRHPIYLSFVGLLWFNPLMSIDRLTLALLWTTHLLVGSHLKDRRLEKFIGEPYKQYQSQVPGYPLLRGPLGRRKPLLVKTTPQS